MASLTGRVTFVILALCAGNSLLAAQAGQERTAVGEPSLADTRLTQDVWGMIKIWAMVGASPAGCSDSLEIGARVIAESPKDGNAKKNGWVEHWTVHRCQSESRYRVAFKPARGGTTFDVARLDQ